jgi:hypothetical protein
MELLIILSIINLPLSFIAAGVIIKLLKDRKQLEETLNKYQSYFVKE